MNANAPTRVPHDASRIHQIETMGLSSNGRRMFSLLLLDCCANRCHVEGPGARSADFELRERDFGEIQSIPAFGVIE